MPCSQCTDPNCIFNRGVAYCMTSLGRYGLTHPTFSWGPFGWICPVCRASNSPQATTCVFCPPPSPPALVQPVTASRTGFKP